MYVPVRERHITLHTGPTFGDRNEMIQLSNTALRSEEIKLRERFGGMWGVTYTIECSLELAQICDELARMRSIVNKDGVPVYNPVSVQVVRNVDREHWEVKADDDKDKVPPFSQGPIPSTQVTTIKAPPIGHLWVDIGCPSCKKLFTVELKTSDGTPIM